MGSKQASSRGAGRTIARASSKYQHALKRCLVPFSPSWARTDTRVAVKTHVCDDGRLRMVSRVLFRSRQLLDGGWGESRGDHFSARRVAAPGRESAHAPSRSGLPVPIGRTSRELCDLARGGVYRAPIVANRAVRSYRTISPLPDPGFHPAIGGVFSVALSLTRDRDAEAPCSGRWVLPTTVSCRARTFLPGSKPPERSPHPQRRTIIGEVRRHRTGAWERASR